MKSMAPITVRKIDGRCQWLGAVLILCLLGCLYFAVRMWRDTSLGLPAEVARIESPSSGPGSPGEIHEGLRVPATEANEADSTSTPAFPFMVTSAVGFEFENVFVDGETFAVREGRVLGLAKSPPFLIGAPGHAEMPVEVGATSAELVPEFALLFERTGLERGLRSVSLLDKRVVPFASRSVIAQFVTPHVLALAIDWAVYADDFDADPTVWMITLDHHLYRSLARRGARGVHHLPLDWAEPETMHLEADAVCPHGCESGLAWSLWPELPTERPTSGSDRSYDWGTLHVQEYPTEQSLREAGSHAAAELVVGRRYGLGALCRSCGCYGRELIDARRGSAAIALAMHPGTTVIVPKDRVPIGAVLRARVEFLDEAGAIVKSRWNGALPLREDEGDYRVTMPPRLPYILDLPWPMPARARLTLEVDGCEPLRESVLLAGEDVVLRDLDWPCQEPILTLDAPAGETWMTIFWARSGAQARAEILGVRETPDRRVLLFGERELFAADSPAHAIVKTETQGIALVRGEDAVYREVPSETTHLAIQVDSSLSVDELWIGWSWEGIDCPISFVDRSYWGEPEAWGVQRPATGVHLWWSDHERRELAAPGVGGEVEFPVDLELWRIP